MSTTPDFSWQHPDRPWWVKLRRAGVHIRELAAGIEDFMVTRPWTVETEPGREPGEVVHRFRAHAAPPADLLAVAGDAVHALRSALDAMAYGIATLHTGPLSLDQERATSFLICETEAAFETELDKKKRGHVLRDLYGPDGVAGLRCVQPFAGTDEARSLGVEVQQTSAEDLVSDGPYRLDTLWNVDKHRRLPGLAWFFDIVYYPGERVAWRQEVDQHSLIEDGAVLATHRIDDSAGSPVVPHWEIGLTLADDPWPYARDVVGVLRAWHSSLGGWVVPRAFHVATTGSKPPLLIGAGWPYMPRT